MRGILKVATAPPDLPVTLAELKARLRIDDTDEDNDLDSMIRAVTAHLDGPSGVLSRCLVEQTWDYVLPCFPDRIVLPLAPFRSVTSITYLDVDGNTQSLASNGYRVVERGDDAFSELWTPRDGDWPDVVSDEPEAVTVRATFGYAPSSDSPPDYGANVPDDIKAAIMLQVGTMYQAREETMPANWQLTDAAWRLLRPKRLSWV